MTRPLVALGGRTLGKSWLLACLRKGMLWNLKPRRQYDAVWYDEAADIPAEAWAHLTAPKHDLLAGSIAWICAHWQECTK